MTSHLLDVKQAQQRLLEHFSRLEIETVSLHNAAGRVLYSDVQAAMNYPVFRNSAMDGFAVRHQDIKGASQDKPRTLKVVADIPAGKMVDIYLEPGQAARIMTGAPIPSGADAVVPVENTDFNFRVTGLEAPAQIKVFRFENVGAHIRKVGEDIRDGQIVLKSGHRLRAQDVGLLSMLGIELVKVHRKPRVAIFSSGDELIPPNEPLVPGKIHDANRYILINLVEQLGAKAVDLGIVLDKIDAIKTCLQSAIQTEADLILSSAGVSVGAFDFVRDVVESNGNLDFWRVNMRPGKPIAFGNYAGTPFIGLPGNPVSAFVGFQVFVWSAISKMLGLQVNNRSVQKVKLLEPVSSDGRETFLRVIISAQDNEMVARLTGHQGSGNLLSLVQANALLLMPSGVKSIPAGSYAEIWSLDGSSFHSSIDQ